MSGLADYLLLGYLAVAAVICVVTWVENTRSFFVHGPPSGVMTGLFWPFWASGLLIYGLMVCGRRLFRMAFQSRATAERLQEPREAPEPLPNTTYKVEGEAQGAFGFQPCGEGSQANYSVPTSEPSAAGATSSDGSAS